LRDNLRERTQTEPPVDAYGCMGRFEIAMILRDKAAAIFMAAHKIE